MSQPTSSRSDLSDALSGWPPPVLDPTGPISQSITSVAWFLIFLILAIFLLVMAALWISLRGSAELKVKLGGEKVVLWMGLIIPSIILGILLVVSLSLTARISGLRGDEPRMRIAGNIYWWRVDYLDGQGNSIIRDANELHIPVGQPVLLELVSEDVIHSFWVPKLAGKMDTIPGRLNTLKIQADEPGVYGGQCAEFCGGAHSLMGFVVVAHEPAAWKSWIASRAGQHGVEAPVQPQATMYVPNPAPGQSRSASAPPTRTAAMRPSDPPGTRPDSGSGRNDAPGGGRQARATQLNGFQAFMNAGCAACHTIAGTQAQGKAGPDLTNVGSRRSLGAGILPNNRGTLAGWIADSQSIKPNNRMPSYDSMSADELNAIADYLADLK